MRKVRLLVLTCGLVCLGAWAQDVISVDEKTLEAHVNQRVAPVYPPIAKVARVQGTVVFNVRIRTTGEIESMHVVSGPPMLLQAAIDALKQWTFLPLERDGVPVIGEGHISIRFDLGELAPTAKEEEIAARYFPLSEKCRAALATRDNSSATGDICKQAADTADEFPPDVRFIEKRSAFVSAAWALGNSGNFTNALVYAEKAVAVVKLGHDDNSGSSAAYAVRGVIEGNLHDLPAADRDLTTAEDFERKAIAWADEVKFEHGDSYRKSLAQYLKMHAALLLALGRADDAKTKLDEAAKFN